MGVSFLFVSTLHVLQKISPFAGLYSLEKFHISERQVRIFLPLFSFLSMLIMPSHRVFSETRLGWVEFQV